jgi:hypothetical protein
LQAIAAMLWLLLVSVAIQYVFIMPIDGLLLKCIVEAVSAVHEGTTALSAVASSHPGVDRRRVASLIAKLPDMFQPGEEGGPALKRAIWDLLPGGGGQERPSQLYCPDEFEIGIWECCAGMKTKKEVHAFYGIKPDLTQERKSKVRHYFGVHEKSNDDFAEWCLNHEEAVRGAISDHFGKKVQGPQHLLEDVEAHVIAKIASQLDELGFGLDKDGLKDLISRVLKAKGNGLLDQATTEVEKKEARRYIDCKISKHFMSTNFSNKRQGDVLESEHRQKPFQKVSNISQKRAAAASPILSSIMTKKFKTFYADLYLRGVTSTLYPAADQVEDISKKVFYFSLILFF